MHDQAGTVIGGMTDGRRPYAPFSISRERTGSSARQRSSRSEGSAQSSPMIITFIASPTEKRAERSRENREVPPSVLEVAERLEAPADGRDLLVGQAVLLVRRLLARDEVPEDVDAEFRDRVKPGALDHLTQALVQRSRDLEGNVVGARPGHDTSGRMLSECSGGTSAEGLDRYPGLGTTVDIA